MKLNIKTTNISLTPSIQDYFEKKLAMLSRFVDFERDNIFVQAELGKTTEHHRSGDIFRAEINLRVGGDTYRSVSETTDLYSAIDAVKDDLGSKIKNGKERKVSLVRRGAKQIKKLLRFGKHESDERS